MTEWFAKCSDFRSDHIVTNVDGTRAAALRHIGKQTEFLDTSDRLVRFFKPLKQWPSGEPSVDGETDFTIIKCCFNLLRRLCARVRPGGLNMGLGEARLAKASV